MKWLVGIICLFYPTTAGGRSLMNHAAAFEAQTASKVSETATIMQRWKEMIGQEHDRSCKG